MLSREADACFWIGRYVERAEATARMVDVHYHAALETGRIALSWSSLLAVSDGAELYAQRYGQENDRDALHFFAFDPANPDAIVPTWTRARQNARTIRDQISSEMWESLNIAYLSLREWDVDRLQAESPATFFAQVRNASHLFQGILNRTLLMGEARDWLDAGRFLERADQTGRLLDVKYHDLLPHGLQRQSAGEPAPDPLGVGGPLDTYGWVAVLKSVSAFEMFRKTHRDGIHPANIVEFLVLDRRFPASVRHGVERVEGCLKRIRDGESAARYGEPERMAGRLLADLTYARAREVIGGGLHEFLSDVQVRIGALGSSIAQTYLGY